MAEKIIRYKALEHAYERAKMELSDLDEALQIFSEDLKEESETERRETREQRSPSRATA